MKDLKSLNNCRIYHDKLKQYNQNLSNGGVFEIQVNGETYSVIASSNDGWDHVSVSHPSKLPSHEVMQKIKQKFFQDSELAVEFHPKKEDYVNYHPNCLHLWRPQLNNIPFPDIKSIMRSKPQITSKGIKVYGGKPHYITKTRTDDFEFVTIRSAFSNRPDWNTMCEAKQELLGDVVAITYHPPKNDPLFKLLKNNPDTLMVFHCLSEDVKTPPSVLVGPKTTPAITPVDISEMC